MKTLDPRLKRLDESRVSITNPHGISATLFANSDVPVEPSAVTELLEMLEVSQTLREVAKAQPDAFDQSPSIEAVAVTPDFHKAKGIPVGTVIATKGFSIPQAVGNDINCGMRLHVTSLTAEDVYRHRDELETEFRRIYFEGGRNIPMQRVQREAMFRNGLTGLLETTPRSQTEGQWAEFHQCDWSKELSCVDRRGSLKANSVFGLNDFMGPPDRMTRDGQIGSIGGGNHFVEIQVVDQVIDGTTAHAWGLKAGAVTVMIHSGSLSIGHLCGNYFRDVVRQLHPESLKHPANGIFLLPSGSRNREQAELFRDSVNNAGNFAFANRLFLGLMAITGLKRICGDLESKLVYDAPHNFLWSEEVDGVETVIHRKGACPARGFDAMAGTPFEYFGEPVLVPGSMGASSFVLAGRGNQESFCSASHGAGRMLSRGEAQHGHEAEFQEFLERFRVVTPVDFRRADVRQRRDIYEKKMDEIRQEAPYAYKGIGAIIRTHTNASIASPVAELTPLMTMKG